MPTMRITHPVQWYGDQPQIAANAVKIQQTFARAEPCICLLQGQNVSPYF